MPYIKQTRRHPLNIWLKKASAQIENEGDLNFAITTLCKHYMSRHGVCYGTINALIGVLQCASLELYRRIASPYEDEKIHENGDAY